MMNNMLDSTPQDNDVQTRTPTRKPPPNNTKMSQQIVWPLPSRHMPLLLKMSDALLASLYLQLSRRPATGNQSGQAPNYVAN